MSFFHRILLIVIGSVIVQLLQTLVLLFVTRFVSTNRNLFGFGDGLIVIVIFFLGLWALVYSTAITFINSLSLSIIFSLIFSIWMSWRTFQNAIEIYERTDYFDREFFVSDIIEISANFLIYPLVALFIWKLKTQYFLTEN
jgi:hypothetical protein